LLTVNCCSGRIAQLVRALRLHRRGPGFEPLCAHKSSTLNKKQGVIKMIELKIYGCRGSIPAPITAKEVDEKIVYAVTAAIEAGINADEVKKWIKKELAFWQRGTYGGDTTCISVKCGDIRLILDMGSGLRRLGQDLLPEMFSTKGMSLYFLMSHVHWDHVQGFPFFSPLFVPKSVLPKNKFYFYGGTNWQKTLEEVLRGQMDPPTFPVEWSKVVKEGPEMSFEPVYNNFFRKISGDSGPVTLRCTRLHHPNETYGWRIEFNGKTFVFATDTEPFDGGPDKVLLDLAKEADILYLDGQFSRDQYLGRIGISRQGWGHGYGTWCAEVAEQAEVKRLIIGHHDPGSSDYQIETNTGHARTIFVETVAAYDGMELSIE
jgi:phosphoribosyl 1,2-cyclic phosphodiesterase